MKILKEDKTLELGLKGKAATLYRVPDLKPFENGKWA